MRAFSVLARCAVISWVTLTACAVDEGAGGPAPAEAAATQAVTDWCQVLANCIATSQRDNGGALIPACVENFGSLCRGVAE